MAAEILRGIVKVGHPTKIGNTFVLIERMKSPDEMYFRQSKSRDDLGVATRKRLTFPPRKS